MLEFQWDVHKFDLYVILIKIFEIEVNFALLCYDLEKLGQIRFFTFIPNKPLKSSFLLYKLTKAALVSSEEGTRFK